MGLKDLMDKYGADSIVKSGEWLSLRQYDEELGQEYDAEAYKLDDITIVYDYRSGTWQDNKGRVYSEILEDGKITGFTREPQGKQGQT